MKKLINILLVVCLFGISISYSQSTEVTDHLILKWDDDNDNYNTATDGNSHLFTSGQDGGSYPFENRGNLILQSRVNNSNDIIFATGAAPTLRMVITGTGNVAIGGSDPGSYKLAVYGKINAKEVKVTATVPGPDYVFDPDYDLMPLADLGKYLSKNKHPPEVPSAKEMETNGIMLGEMNMLLLKKIEELTLHTIRQEKEIQELKKELTSIQK